MNIILYYCNLKSLKNLRLCNKDFYNASHIIFSNYIKKEYIYNYWCKHKYIKELTRDEIYYLSIHYVNIFINTHYLFLGIHANYNEKLLLYAINDYSKIHLFKNINCFYSILFTNEKLTYYHLKTNKIKIANLIKHVQFPSWILKKVDISTNILCKYQVLDMNMINALVKKNVCWTKLCKYQTLNENFIRKNINSIPFKIISQHQKLSEKFIHDYCNELYWDLICKYQILSEKFIEEHANHVNWRKISRMKLSPAFIYKHKNKLVLEYLPNKDELDVNFINANYDKLYKNTNQITSKHQLQKILSPYIDINANQLLSHYVIDTIISKCPTIKLSICIINNDFDFIKKYHKYINWNKALKCAPLEVIYKCTNYYSEKIDWDIIFKNYTLDHKFILKHMHRVSLHIILKTQYKFIINTINCVDDTINCNTNAINCIGKYMDDPYACKLICKYQLLDFNFIQKYKDKINWIAYLQNTTTPNIISAI